MNTSMTVEDEYEGGETTPIVAVASPESDLGPTAAARQASREVFQVDQSIQGPIPSIRLNAKAWFKYFDHNEDDLLSKAQILQAVIDTINSITGETPDIGVLMDSMDCLWAVSGVDDSEEINAELFAARDGLWEAIVSSLIPLPPLQASQRRSVRIYETTGTSYGRPQEIIVECGECTARVIEKQLLSPYIH